jgi:dephospho-CoA kinase
VILLKPFFLKILAIGRINDMIKIISAEGSSKKLLVIGLTGGIASGKSMVSAYLKELGALIIDADVIARELVYPQSPAWQEIVRHFGRKIVYEDGSLKRKELGELIFRCPEERKRLNEIMHPRIKEKIAEQIELYRSRGKFPLLVVDAPLLIEAGLTGLVDEVWLVDLPEKLQLERLRKRDKLTQEEAQKRIASQLSLAEKKKYARRIIDNSGEITETKEKIRFLWKQVVE